MYNNATTHRNIQEWLAFMMPRPGKKIIVTILMFGLSSALTFLSFCNFIDTANQPTGAISNGIRTHNPAVGSIIMDDLQNYTHSVTAGKRLPDNPFISWKITFSYNFACQLNIKPSDAIWLTLFWLC